MKYTTAIIALAVATAANAYTITSPNGRVEVNVDVDGQGIPLYSVKYDGNTFLQPSRLGLITDMGLSIDKMNITGATGPERVKYDYSLPNIKKSHVEGEANKAVYTFSKDSTAVYDLEMWVGDNDVAFRYKLLPIGEHKCAKVNMELTEFKPAEGTTSYLCPQMAPMSGFARTAPSYETSYVMNDSLGKNGWGYGYTFPCLFRNGDKGWMLISETGVKGDYCASHLRGMENNTYLIEYPNAKEMNGLGTQGAGVTLPGFTPWRTITLGDNLRPIVETTIPWDVTERLYEPSKKYDYSKGTWSWIIKMDSSCNFDEQKRYIDFSRDLGYETVLVDALWDTQIGREGVEELARYGKEQGVDLYLWYNSNGYWNDAPQGPRNLMNDARTRRNEMQWMKEHGIRGIKVDFFGSDKQEMMKLYHDILCDANDYGILVIFHGCTLPRGWEKMYPNYAASEAVLASENLHFNQRSCDTEAHCAAIHPFVRNTVGSMDFGGSALNKWYNANNTPNRGSKRLTSDVFALATAVLFQSPVQHFALAPNNLTDAPDWAIGFMKEVPTTWDDIRYIDGYPGKYIVLARRHGDDWYLAGVNGSGEPVKLDIQLPEEMAGKALRLYSDDKDLNGKLTTEKAPRKGILKVTIPDNGGVLATTKL